MPSYKIEVTTDEGKSWATNALRFKTKDAAMLYGPDLFSRWLLVTDWQVVESDDDPTPDQRDVKHWEAEVARREPSTDAGT